MIWGYDGRKYESAAERDLCERAYELHCDEGAPSPMTYARAAEEVFGHAGAVVIADDYARDQLEFAGVCADCLRLLDAKHRGCVP